MSHQASIPVVMPQLGQAMASGIITEWHVENGGMAVTGAPLLTIESDKASFEIEAAASGPLHHLVAQGESVNVGVVIAHIGDAPIPAASSAPVARASDPVDARIPPPSASGRVPATPKARMAAKGRIDLACVKPSRADGLIDVADVERALSAVTAGEPPENSGVELPASRLQLIDRLVRSWQQAPHFVQMIDVDATFIRQRLADAKQTGAAVTLNDLLMEACYFAVKAEPSINGHISGTRFVPHDNIVISLAVDTPRGLRTPKIPIEDAALEAIVANRSKIVTAIQEGKPAEGQENPAVVTLSNLGKFGIRAGTPVLNLDEPVLVFAGAVEDRVVPLDEAVVVRPYMTLSIAYDHRLVDGMQAARFSSAIKNRLELGGEKQ